MDPICDRHAIFRDVPISGRYLKVLPAWTSGKLKVN